MTRTPWGDSSELRGRKLAPGSRLPPEEVARNQRERLLGSTVAIVAERGYDATTVAAIVERSGVSRTAFYKHYANKEECFLAAVDATLEIAMTAVDEAYRGTEGSWEERILAAFGAFVGQVIDQPAAARICLVEIYGAGREAVAHVDRSAAAFEEMLRAGYEQSASHAGPTEEVVRGIVAGIRKVLFTQLRLGEESKLPELAPALATWAGTYRTPSAPLRTTRLRSPVEPAPSATHQVDRILEAVAAVSREKGYGALTLDDVAERASTSFSTFYSHFRTKEDAFLASYDFALAQAYAAALPPFQRAPDWPHAIKSALEGLLGYMARQPNLAYAAIVEVLATGRRGMERRDNAITLFQGFLEPGFELAPDLPRVAADGIGGAIFGLLYDHLVADRPERLPELLPTGTFIALAPFIGADDASAIANERRRRARIRVA